MSELLRIGRMAAAHDLLHASRPPLRRIQRAMPDAALRHATLRQLQIFLAAAEHSSFARAAEVAPETEPIGELAAAVERLRRPVEAAALVGPGPYCLDGTYERARGELGSATVALMRCLATRPDDLASRANLGWTFLDLGLAGAARDELDRCLILDPSFGPALAGLEELARRGAIASAGQ